MTSEILYTTAIDSRGNLVHIDTAEKGREYSCPSCKGTFILKKSGNTKKGSKRPHFAHNELTPNCTAESALHYSFKKNLIDLLNTHLSEKKEFLIQWNCNACSEYNKGNLLAKVTSIREEYNLKLCQPDIALLDSESNVVAVIEIVVTHKPEEKVLEFYADKKIILIQINLTTDEDLKNIVRKTEIPDIVDFCHSPKCPNTSKYSISRRAFPTFVNCNRCFSRTEKYFVEVNSAFGTQVPSLNFTDSEIEIVKSNRKNIEIRTNPATNEKYPVAICTNCRILRSRRGGPRF